jgi:hypothetical protein
MIRLVLPVDARTAGDETEAERAAMTFARALFPLLGRHLPD